MLLKTLKSQLWLVLCLVIIGCGSGGSSSGSKKEPTKIVAFGDSIGDPGFGSTAPWPNRVQDGTMIEVRNYSRESQATAYFVGLVESVLDAEQPSHLMILLGTNDARQGIVGSAATNLQFMVDQARNRGIEVIVGTIPPNYRNDGDSVRGAEISELIRGLNGASIAEVRGAFGDDRSLLPDGLHPGSRGQQIIADLFIGEL